MTGELHRWLRHAPLVDWPTRREGKFLKFIKLERQRIMGRPVYNMLMVRGEACSIGRVEYRNQWADWCVKFDEGVPVNQEIVAEVYAMLRELRSK